MNPEHKRRALEGTKRWLRERQCPRCKRLGALLRYPEFGTIVVRCRWCGFEP